MNRIRIIASKLVITGLLVTGMYSCSNTKKIPIEEIEYLYVDYDSEAPNNYGVAMKATVCAQMQSGEARCLKNNSDFVCSYNIVCNIHAEEVIIANSPQAFNQSKVPVTLTLSDKKGNSIQSNDTILLNFKAGVSVYTRVIPGIDGVKGSDGGQALLFRDGKEGNSGTNGSNGQDGNSFDIHIWQEAGVYYYHVTNLTTEQTGRYQTIGAKPFVLDAPGSNGGRGGDGGQGGSGKDGSIDTQNNKVKLPGNGGNGGFGGSGGNGGNGGNIRVVIHPSAADIREQLKLSARPGYGGEAGKGGKGGVAGKPANGQTPAKPGLTGSQGWNGRSGNSGTITIVDESFNPAIYW